MALQLQANFISVCSHLGIFIIFQRGIVKIPDFLSQPFFESISYVCFWSDQAGYKRCLYIIFSPITFMYFCFPLASEPSMCVCVTEQTIGFVTIFEWCVISPPTVVMKMTLVGGGVYIWGYLGGRSRI